MGGWVGGICGSGVELLNDNKDEVVWLRRGECGRTPVGGSSTPARPENRAFVLSRAFQTRSSISSSLVALRDSQTPAFLVTREERKGLRGLERAREADGGTVTRGTPDSFV